MLPIFNSQDTRYKTPFGAAKAGENIHFTLRVPTHYNCTTPYLFLRADKETTPQQILLHKQEEQGDITLFSVTITAPQPGLYFYWFDLWVDYRKLYRGTGGTAYETNQNGGTLYQLTVYDAAFTTPATVHGGTMYQIFPDRFFEGDPNKPLSYNERIYRRNKDREPYFWPTNQEGGYLTQDYFGGDLIGIEKKLPYLHSLGVNWLYLNPIFEAHSNHRYNTADYLRVDPYLGTNEDFAHLCTKAKEYGIRIILDGVFSHTGSDSIYFNKEGRYPSYGAWQGEDSFFRPWYRFNADGSYDSWWGFDTLPNCNKQNESFRSFICDEGGVIDTWLTLGAAGFRLDVADELPDDFIAQIRSSIKRHGSDKLLIGEVWEDASSKEAYGKRRAYFAGHELDGVMNYPFRNSILDVIRTQDAEAFRESVMSICENYPLPALAACTTHISTHDTERAITVLAGEPLNGHDRYWQSERWLTHEQYHVGIARMKLAFVLQFTLPGVPCIYYGDEIAMQGYKDPFNRAFYNWESNETSLTPLLIALADLRANCSAFKTGCLQFQQAQDGLLIYERKDESFTASIALNLSSSPRDVTLLGETITLNPMGYAWRTQPSIDT